MTQLQKLGLDLAPLVIFLVSYYALGVYWATGIFIGATLVAAAVSYSLSGKISPLMMFSGVFVVVLGGLTIWLQNDVFIKLKPTIYYVCVSVILLGGLAAKRLVISAPPAASAAFRMARTAVRSAVARSATASSAAARSRRSMMARGSRTASMARV